MHIIDIIIDSQRVSNPRNFPVRKKSQVNSVTK